jgi:hypothetical protein
MSLGNDQKRHKWGEISAREEAIQIIESVWPEFEPSIDSLVGSFANRVIILKDPEGRTIQPLIPAGKTIVPPDICIGNEDIDRLGRR